MGQRSTWNNPSRFCLLPWFHPGFRAIIAALTPVLLPEGAFSCCSALHFSNGVRPAASAGYGASSANPRIGVEIDGFVPLDYEPDAWPEAAISDSHCDVTPLSSCTPLVLERL